VARMASARRRSRNADDCCFSRCQPLTCVNLLLRESLPHPLRNKDAKKGTVTMTRTALLFGLLIVLGSASIGCQASADGKEWVPTPDEDGHLASTTQALTGTTKVCSAVVIGAWRDSISVPNSWSIAWCQNWANSISATRYQVGCQFDPPGWSWGSLVSIGSAAPTPTSNCGW
jgi:hypothetical protein